MARDLACPKCKKTFQSPRLLPCQYTICQSCLTQSIKGGALRCPNPKCNVKHQVPPEGFQADIEMQRLIDAACSSEEAIRRTATATPSELPNRVRRSQVSPVQVSPGEQTGIHNLPPVEVQVTPRLAVHESNGDMNKSCVKHIEGCLRVVRKGIRKIVGSFLREYEVFMTSTTILLLCLTVARFVAGAVKLNSDCPKEYHVAIYHFVKACFALVFWITLLILACKKKLIDMMDNLFIEFYVVIESLFSLIWFIVGIVWVLANYSAITNECPLLVMGWKYHFVNFAVFLTVVDMIGLVAFGFFSLYVTCDPKNDSSGTSK